MSLDNYKTWILIICIVFVIVSVPLIFLSKKDSDTKNKLENELYIDQIHFKNIQELDRLPIDQSLLFQDKITYYFRDIKKSVDEVEVVKGSFKDLGDNKFSFKIKYFGGELDVEVDKAIIDIKVVK